MKKIAGFVAMSVLAVTVVGCSDNMSPMSPSAPTPPSAGAPTPPASLPTIAGIATGNPNFTTLVAALQKADLVSTFSGSGAFTVFAPTNAAFDAAAGALLGPGTSGIDLVNGLDVATLTAVLKFHVASGSLRAASVVSANQITMIDGNGARVSLNGSAAFIGGARIVSTDIEASNGIVHVIDGVLLPPGIGPSANRQTIAAIAAGNPDFSTLVAALKRAGLVDTFNGSQVFTVFAPTNAAFDEAGRQLGYRNGAELVEKLDIRTLTAVLTYHVMAGEQRAAAVVAADNLHMLSGGAADVRVQGGQVFIDSAIVLKTDILASNGVIHVLGGVLLPH